MLLRTIQASSLKSAFEVLKDIINDVNLVIDSGGISITTLDVARTALVDFKLNASQFDTYEFNENERIIAGINVTNMFKLLKVTTNNDHIEIKLENKEFMEITIANNEKRTETRFKLKLLDIDEDHLIIPDINIICRTIMPSVDFQRICRDMNNLAQDIEISRINNNLYIKCKGDFADQETIIETSDNDFIGELSGLYSLKYMNMFTKATGMCSTVQLIQENDGRFLLLKYNVADLGELDFYLASKVADT